MKKSVQKMVNDNVIENYNRFINHFHYQCGTFSKKHFRTCQAIVCEDSQYIWLKSYDTIVFFYDKNSGYGFDVLRYVYGYTPTSAQHISKFLRDNCYINAVRTYRTIKGE